MNMLDEDLNDSALLCKSLIQKRKAFQTGNPKNCKQMKFSVFKSSAEVNSSNKDKIEVSDDSDVVSTGEKVTSTNNSCNSEWNKSSNYFSEKKFISRCPLCMKSFKTDSVYSAHMKQCAKTHKMTTQQLLEALELQKKQMKERRALGLCSQTLPSPKRHPSKKKTTNKLDSCDLALGLALSKSLVTSESKTVASQEMQKATLEEFGFVSRSAVSGTIAKKKNANVKKSVLKERTTEERQRIIVEKVAVILLDEDQRTNLDSGESNQNSSPQSSEVPQLWSLGENNEKRDWYVSEIKTLVLSDSKQSAQQKSTELLSDNINSELFELNLPQKEFSESWKKMINNSLKSDLFGKTKDDQDVYLHSLVLFARYPEILEKDFEPIFEKFNFSTVLIFLEYLYCGTLNGLTATEIDNLFHLATEIDYKELILVLDRLKSKLSKGKSSPGCQTTQTVRNTSSEVEKTVIEKEKLKFIEEKDLFSEDNIIDLTQDADSDESNVEKSYWSFIQHEKRKNSEEEKKNSVAETQKERKENQDAEYEEREENSPTGDSHENAKTSSDCIILSSGSEPQRGEHSRTPSPVNYEIPYFDPYDNFNLFHEEQFSTEGLNSQSLLAGDVSAESFKLPSPARGDVREEKNTVGYCSTPVSLRQSLKIKSSSKSSVEKFRRRRRCDLSSSRILRKSLGLQQKTRTPKSNSCKRKKSTQKKDIVEALAKSVLHELSKSSIFQRKNFVEITPLPSREEFKESVTPSPNYSIMGESVLKEQLAKYGLKKNLAKSKAKKILRHIYDELHPLYNTETGKIVKMLPSNTPKTGKNSKGKKIVTKNTKKAKRSKSATEKVSNNDLNSSKESQGTSDETIGPNEFDSDGSEFEDLNETLTQSIPSNAIDLPSAFCEFLQNNPDYHQKILLYEPIWLEELQKSLKETFKKHFKISDIMDFLDQKCITFRLAAQAKKLQKRYKKKDTSKKTSPSS